jgi:hypothetical protein
MYDAVWDGCTRIKTENFHQGSKFVTWIRFGQRSRLASCDNVKRDVVRHDATMVTSVCMLLGDIVVSWECRQPEEPLTGKFWLVWQCCAWTSMNEVLPRDQSYGHYWMLWLGDRCSMGIDEWSTTQALVLWPLLNVVTWIQMFHGHRWMKCYPGTVVTWRRMFHGHWWMKYDPSISPTWMVITECCNLNRLMVHGHWWMKCYLGTSPMAITECCDLKTDVPWAMMNEVLTRDSSPTAITECCDLDKDVPWASKNEVLPRDQSMVITECCDWETDVPWASMNEVLPQH